jgi:hypothetical protein
MRTCPECATWRGATSEINVHKRGTYCPTCGATRAFDDPLSEEDNEIQHHTMKRKLRKVDSLSEGARKRLRLA